MIITGTVVASWLGLKFADKAFDSTFEKYFSKLPTLEDELKEAIETVSKELNKSNDSILGASIDFFFKREETFNDLMKVLFSFTNDNLYEFSTTHFSSSTLPKHFIVTFIDKLKKELIKRPNFAILLNDKELFIVVRGIGEDSKLTSNNSALSLIELKEIKEILLKKQQGEYFDYYNFFKKYKQVALNNLSQINFLGLGIESHIRKRNKKLQDIFVKPAFLNTSSNKQLSDFDNEESDSEILKLEFTSFESSIPFEVDEIFNTNSNLVILGDPGSGKSILLKYIVCSILSDEQTAFENKDIYKYLPIRIELRKYLSHKRNFSCNFSSYLKHLLETEYGIMISVSNIDFIINNKSLLILFDGLDEIFDTGDKVNIKNDIEVFCLNNENVKAITTSRFIGYSEAKLDDNYFQEFSIQEFEERQIRDYVNKWYNFEEQDEDARKKEVQEFLEKKSKLDNELVKNPLLLSLIVILFRNNLKLPESKLEIYQSCTKTLVERWDANKNLEIGLDASLLKKKEIIIAELAYWQYKTLSSKSIKITYQKAKKTIADCLINKLKIVDNLIEALQLAENFLQYAENRSIYFDNNFTHKTFLEYYTAYWIYSNYDKKQLSSERDKLITKYIDNSYWNIVLELLLNMIDDDQPDNEIIDKIFIQQSKKPSAMPFLVEVLPTLENISPLQKKNVLETTLRQLILTRNRGIFTTKVTRRNLFELLNKALTQQPSLINLFLKALLQIRLDITTIKERYNFFTLLYELPSSAYRRETTYIDELEKLKKTNGDFQSVVNTSEYVWMLNVYNDREGGDFHFEKVKDFLNTFGSKSFFKDFDANYADYQLLGVYHYFMRTTVKVDVTKLREQLMSLQNFGLPLKDLEKGFLNKIFFSCTEEELKSIFRYYNTDNLESSITNILSRVVLTTFRRDRSLFEKLESYVPNEISKVVKKDIIKK